MLTLKIGRFPGRINEYVVENGITVADALRMAEIEVDSESDVKFNTNRVTTSDTIDENGTLVVTKRIKGNR